MLVNAVSVAMLNRGLVDMHTSRLFTVLGASKCQFLPYIVFLYTMVIAGATHNMPFNNLPMNDITMTVLSLL